ncbi:MAG: hypothetical protein A2V67_15085 [Deltaproteobacteria bacterium RBG_13_61_14]|nr:MAG: hypothetical protein A2V67_15085 [Deltaproteobacteria bacterium RBG_13_61_14]
MTAPPIIAQLIATFDRNRDSYRSPAYNEHQLRVEFLDPFFIALGWDVYNAAGYALQYRDVVHEDAIKIGVATKAPDYCFRVGGRRKFFLEAKKPSLDIKTNPEPAFQLRRYAWSAKLPLSILSDFEELAVYDCRVKPEPGDPAAAGRLFFYRYPDYLERWPELESVFSKEAVLKGSFDRFAESAKKKKGTAEVDDAFLKEIESWRELLAKNIALRNPRLTNRELNFAVQATLDRIIFLRICEDRGIENYGLLQALLNGQNLYRRLFQLFDRADDKYNSGLFHFKPEKNRPEPDTLTPRLAVDDKPLKEIIKRLYYPESPYEFSVLPADILGQVYEQFLGKVIRLTAGHQAKVEDKPEVKKAGGVYYTPTYIVDYIVKNTVGRLLEGKTPEDVAATAPRSRNSSGKKKKGGTDIPVCQPLRILDPACGSGSFLLGAYQYLLDWYRDQYVQQMTADSDRRGAPLCAPPTGQTRGSAPTKIYQTAANEWRLTISERKRILLDHLFGVDIDPSAVEVTKLSLLLKCLEGESEETLKQMMLFHKERALPDLSANIKCGNSLIGPDFYQQKQLSLIDEEERYRINVFDWKAGFPEVFHHRDTESTEGRGVKGNREPGTANHQTGFDVVIGNPPYVNLANITDKNIREYLQKEFETCKNKSDLYSFFAERAIGLLKELGVLGFIFSNSWLGTDSFSKFREYLINNITIYELVKLPPGVFKGATVTTVLIFLRKEKSKQDHSIELKEYTSGDFRSLPYNLSYKRIKSLPKLGFSFNPQISFKIPTIKLEETANFSLGIKTSDDKRFILDKKKDYCSYPLLRGKDVRRYFYRYAGKWIWYMPDLMMQKVGAGPRKAEYFTTKKIMFRSISGGSIMATLEPGKYFTNDKVHILYDLQKYSFEFILGLLNSKVIEMWIRSSFGDLLEIKINQLQEIPIPVLNFSDPSDKDCHDRMVDFVDRMLDLHKRKAAAKVPADRDALERQIAATDAEIDRLVYELYGLTEEEIKIVEGEH